MRLTDADALLSLIDDSKIEHFYGGVTIVHLSDLVRVIHNMPAVDAAPVVHGRWIDHKDEHQCSACKEFTAVDAHVWMQLRYDFCPYCGAKMDGGETNGGVANPENAG